MTSRRSARRGSSRSAAAAPRPGRPRRDSSAGRRRRARSGRRRSGTRSARGPTGSRDRPGRSRSFAVPRSTARRSPARSPDPPRSPTRRSTRSSTPRHGCPAPSATRPTADRGRPTRPSRDRGSPCACCRRGRSDTRSDRRAGRRSSARPCPTAGSRTPPRPRCSTVRAPSRTRSRFHQPLRSDAKTRSPVGLHSGSQIDSSPARPATALASPSSASADSGATNSSVPSHGIQGRSQASHASDDPSGEIRGDE